MNLTSKTTMIYRDGFAFGSYRIYNVDATSDFWDIDEAVYRFEQPFYAYCASGAGCDCSRELPGWDEERARLMRLWNAKYPRVMPVAPTLQQTSWVSGLWNKLFAAA